VLDASKPLVKSVIEESLAAGSMNETEGGREGTGVRTCHVPRLIMGSMVKMWPGLTMPFAWVVEKRS
jgi:hypothetical protein